MGFLISLKRKFRQFKKFFQDHQQAFNFIIVFLFFAIVGPLGINQIFYRPPVFPIFKVSWEIGDGDILGNHYSQKYPIVIGKEGTHYCITIDWSGVQTSDEEKKIHTY